MSKNNFDRDKIVLILYKIFARYLILSLRGKPQVHKSYMFMIGIHFDQTSLVIENPY